MLLLDERRAVEAELELSRAELLQRRERADPGAAAAEVRLRPAPGSAAPPRRPRPAPASLIDARARVADSQPGGERGLARLRELELVRAHAVQDRRADRVEVGEVLARVEDRLRVPARPRGRAHAVDEQRVRALRLGRVERVSARHARASYGNPAPLELREQRHEPERVLVEDADGLLHAPPTRGCRAIPAAEARRRANRPRLEETGPRDSPSDCLMGTRPPMNRWLAVPGTCQVVPRRASNSPARAMAPRQVPHGSGGGTRPSAAPSSRAARPRGRAVEPEPRQPGERDLLAVLDQRRPPLDRGAVAVHDRSAEAHVDFATPPTARAGRTRAGSSASRNGCVRKTQPSA